MKYFTKYNESYTEIEILKTTITNFIAGESEKRQRAEKLTKSSRQKRGSGGKLSLNRFFT